MEVNSSSCQHNNKENIPPFAQNQIHSAPPVVQTCSAKNAKRRLRRPLRDITHLFNSQIQSNLAQDTGFQLPSPVPAPALNFRKRKAIDDIDSMHQMNSKSLRMNFR
ncbi:hypothetical protein RHGRI_017586 [Rhododendron griersonianum]|uniref:Uncharacterized protein n=1 Tax=Rhododendron griersonianum TaxID=479676 RepID=A0AAV6JYF7_9ERIC|nr:hypothetical protein RHGRI_017586 [Rhododendron griersonianum]